MSHADTDVQEAMARGNADYEERFGRIYLVAAAGRSADELLGLLRRTTGQRPGHRARGGARRARPHHQDPPHQRTAPERTR